MYCQREVIRVVTKPVARHLMNSFNLSKRVACQLAGIRRMTLRYQYRYNEENALLNRLKELTPQYTRYDIS